MQTDCSHCGATRAVGIPPGGGRAVCAQCGAEPRQLGQIALRQVPQQTAAVEVEYGLSDRPVDFSLFDDAPPPPPPPVGVAPEFGTLGGPISPKPPQEGGGLIFSQPPPAGLPPLGAADQGAGDAFDLSAILEPMGAEPPVAQGSPPKAFTFGGEDDPFGGQPGALSGGQDGIVLPDRAVEIRPQVEESASSGWRVRGERGVVYELMTVDAVVAWLEGKADVSNVQVSQDGGPFSQVNRFSELSSRLGLQADEPVGAAKSAPKNGPSNAFEEPPALQMDDAAAARVRASRAAPRGPGHVTERAPAPAGEGRRKTATSAQRKSVDNPLGYGVVLVAVVAAGLIVAGLAILGVSTGMMHLPPPVSLTEEAPQISPGLNAAVEAIDAERYASATRQLRQLAKTDKDPRVLRYLTIALHRANRVEEARATLADYRRLMLEANGEDGRQVRKVRD